MGVWEKVLPPPGNARILPSTVAFSTQKSRGMFQNGGRIERSQFCHHFETYHKFWGAERALSISSWGEVYCITSALDGYVTLLDRTPCTQMMTSQSICSKDFCGPWYTHLKKYYPPSAHLLPSGLLPSKPTTCGQSVPLAVVHRSCDLGPTCGTHHCGENVENAVEEMDNRIPRETKCHSETIKVTLMEKCILRSLIWSGLMYPPFWFSMLESKKAMLILLQGNLRSLSQKGSSYPPSSHT